jgi:hypothetical protein
MSSSTQMIDAEMSTTARNAAAYLRDRAYPQAAALGVVLEAVAPGRYRVQPQDSFDGAGNRHYALIDDAEGSRYAVAGKTYGELLVWIGKRADDRSSSEDAAFTPPVYTDHNGVPTAKGLQAMFAAADAACPLGRRLGIPKAIGLPVERRRYFEGVTGSAMVLSWRGGG